MPDHVPGCSCCGAPLDPVNLDIRTFLPDPILALPPQERAAAWGDRNLQQLDGVGAFVRCLMPVRLTDGGRVTFSVWLGVHPDRLRRAYEDWDTPAYAGLTLDGVVANAIQPWPDLFGEPARAEVRDPDTLPYLVAVEGSQLSRVLDGEWDRDDVLRWIAHPLPVAVRQPVTAEWSIERSAGLGSRVADGILVFTGPGRTVRAEPFDVPATMTVEAAADLLGAGPAQRDGELTEREGPLLRQAFWRSATVDGGQRFELYGIVAVPGTVLRVSCVYDDPTDLGWARDVWRSVRHGDQLTQRQNG